MLTNIKETISAYNMIEAEDNIIVALSGGADSVALLFSLYSLRNELNFKLSACHVNHLLRGSESDSDMDYVISLCEKLKIPLNVRKIDVKLMQLKHESLEECARRARYDFFNEISFNSKIATAHTANDNCETVLLNLVRGTALKGLCGIPPVRGNIIRPLLNTTRSEIEDYCNENNLKYVTDKTNLSDDYTRNKIRHNVIPLLTEINPALLTSVERMTQAVMCDNAYLDELSRIEAEKALADGGYNARKLSSLPQPVLSRIIAFVLTEKDIKPSSLRIKMITEIIKKGMGKVNIEKNKFAVVRKHIFSIKEIQQHYRNDEK